MTVARYMALCLGHPEHGYYRRADPFGARGDFVTAPEVSQMFGELLGLWAAQLWLDMGRPAPVRLVELGPGRGTLMADALRAARAAPGFIDAAEIWMVETSRPLRATQAARVPGVRHAERLEGVPGGPMILLANEFFDALPIRQFVRTPRGWAERVVGLGAEGLRWGLGPAPADLPEAPDGAVIERCAAGEAIAAEIGARLARDGGGALIVDYGAAAPATGGGDTLQALRAHAHADPLAEPGAADLTAHVDFARLAAALVGAGAAVAPLTTQGALLGTLGIGARAAALAARNPAQESTLEGQLRRLCEPAQMGALFKALAATGPGQPPPPGFEPAP